MARYIFTGEEHRDERGRYIIPEDANHVTIHPSVTVIPARLFYKHPNIIELICHDGVEKIEYDAFYECPRLKRVIIRGVKIVEGDAFWGCKGLEYVDCPKLERIEASAFMCCISLSNVNLPSAKIVEIAAFYSCEALTDAKFGRNLETINELVFHECSSLERITIPLKNGLIADDTFKECANLRRVDLIERAELHETVATLLLEGWRDDMKRESDSINHILPHASAGKYDEDEDADDPGEKAIAIREWIARVLSKIVAYKAQHRYLLNEAAYSLQLVLPDDIVVNNVVPFLELSSHTFQGEENDSDSDNDGS